MKIGIISSGKIGGTLLRLFSRSGDEVAVSNSRGPETLAGLVEEAGGGARAATVEDAAEFGEVVVVAVPLHVYRELPADHLAGRIVVDANNYYAERDGSIAELDDDSTTSTELLAAQLPDSRVVKAFNTMNHRALGSEGRPDAPRDERLAIFLAGDDEGAKETVAAMIDELGFAPVDTGGLADGGRRQQPGAPVYGATLTAPEAEAALRG
jgi:8-hydroxy-5-deazaflavin:NADPH oxidoreductase